MAQVVLFEIDGQVYGFDIACVESIEKLQPTTRVPGTADFLRGLMNLRGVITPVIDGRKFFGRPGFTADMPSRTIILSQENIRVGFMVDGTRNVVDVDSSQIQQAPAEMEEDVRVRLKGVIYVDGKAVGLLDESPVLDSSTAVL